MNDTNDTNDTKNSEPVIFIVNRGSEWFVGEPDKELLEEVGHNVEDYLQGSITLKNAWRLLLSNIPVGRNPNNGGVIIQNSIDVYPIGFADGGRDYSLVLDGGCIATEEEASLIREMCKHFVESTREQRRRAEAAAAGSRVVAPSEQEVSHILSRAREQGK